MEQMVKNIQKDALNFKFKELLKEINKNDVSEASPRGLKVKEKLMTNFSIDPLYPCVDFSSREFNYKYFAGELAWYLLRDKRTDFINNFSNFWKKLENPDGTVNSNYGSILLSKTDEIKANSYSLKDSIERNLSISQMAWICNTLRKDKYSRQAIAYIGGSKYQFEGNKDFVCTQYILFYIRNNELNMKVQMRSNDIFYGLTYDVPWFSTVHQNVYLELLETYPDLKLGKYHHFSDNTHFYSRHFEITDEILNEKSTNNGPKLVLKKPLWYSHRDGRTYLSLEAEKYMTWFHSRRGDFEDLTNKAYLEVLSLIYEIEI